MADLTVEQLCVGLVADAKGHYNAGRKQASVDVLIRIRCIYRDAFKPVPFVVTDLLKSISDEIAEDKAKGWR